MIPVWSMNVFLHHCQILSTCLQQPFQIVILLSSNKHPMHCRLVPHFVLPKPAAPDVDCMLESKASKFLLLLYAVSAPEGWNQYGSCLQDCDVLSLILCCFCSWVLRVCCWKVGLCDAIQLLLRIYMGSRGVTKFLIKLIVKKASQRSQGFFCSKPMVLAGVFISKLLAWSRICLNHQTSRIESCWSLVFHYIQTGLSQTPPPRIYKNLLNLWFSTMICRWLPGHCWSLRSGGHLS